MCGVMSPTNPPVPALTTATAVNPAQPTNTKLRHASSFMPTLRARSSPAASTFRGRAMRTANATAKRAVIALAQGSSAHSRSPASQNTMPRRLDTSATDSKTVTIAPHALASTTPVRSSRVVPPLRASRCTITTATTAPATADPWTANTAPPAIMASKAPTAAPPDTPSTKGSASGLRKSACKSEQTPDAEGRQGARQPHGERHAAGHGVAGPQQCRHDPRRRELGAAHEQRADEHRGSEQQQAGKAFPGAAAHPMECGDRLQFTAADVKEGLAYQA